MIEAPALIPWRHDPENWTPAVHTDASRIGVGGTLALINKETGMHHIVRFASKLLSPCQAKHYSVPELELWGLCWLLQRWREFLLLETVEVFTDHKSLLGWRKFDEKNLRLVTMKMTLNNYRLNMHYVKGEKNFLGDMPSRLVPDYTPDEEFDQEIAARRIEEVGWCLHPTDEQMRVAESEARQETSNPIHIALLQAERQTEEWKQDLEDFEAECDWSCPM